VAHARGGAGLSAPWIGGAFLLFLSGCHGYKLFRGDTSEGTDSGVTIADESEASKDRPAIVPNAELSYGVAEGEVRGTTRAGADGRFEFGWVSGLALGAKFDLYLKVVAEGFETLQTRTTLNDCDSPYYLRIRLKRK
jgi:hypothetical protein